MLTLLDGINFITKSIVKYRKEILRRKVSLPHHFRAERRYFFISKNELENVFHFEWFCCSHNHNSCNLFFPIFSRRWIFFRLGYSSQSSG